MRRPDNEPVLRWLLATVLVVIAILGLAAWVNLVRLGGRARGPAFENWATTPVDKPWEARYRNPAGLGETSWIVFPYEIGDGYCVQPRPASRRSDSTKGERPYAGCEEVPGYP